MRCAAECTPDNTVPFFTRECPSGRGRRRRAMGVSIHPEDSEGGDPETFFTGLFMVLVSGPFKHCGLHPFHAERRSIILSCGYEELCPKRARRTNKQYDATEFPRYPKIARCGL